MDVRPLTVALDTVEARDVKRGDMVLNEEHKLVTVNTVSNHKGFCYIGLENGNTWFVMATDCIRRVRK